jgi:S-DNA-T family DNA segregation ATPase FtsK/SpoIIIE
MYTGQKRFWPKAVSIELRRLPWRILGSVLIALAAALLLALLSWSFADPGPNNATGSHPQNWLGYHGAGAAQALMEGFGLAAPLIVLPLAALGFHIAAGYAPLRPRLRFLFWASALLAAPGFFASFSIPPRWLLGTGLGGIFGDFVAGRIAKLSPAIPPPYLWPLSALLFFILGAWCVWRACGLTGEDLVLALEAPARGQDSARPLQEAFTRPPGASDFANKVTSWVKRLSPRNRAIVLAERPREFWMQARKGTAAKEEPPYEGSSPFSNWGGGLAAARPAKHRVAKRAPAAEEPVRPEAAKPVESTAKTADEASGENGYDDIRIEPFFGPKPGSPPPGAAGGAPGSGRNPPSSPFLRLTGKSTKTASAGTQRLFASLAQGVKSRAPLIFVKNKPAAPPMHSEGHGHPAAPAIALPQLSLLAPLANGPRHKDSMDPVLMQRASALMSVLEDFGVKGRFSAIYPGPIVTLFELEPARGTKPSRVSGLADDIARSMRAPSARVALIPGRDTIGIELANPRRETVSLRAILEAPAYQNSSAALPLALGRSIGGDPVIADLARMPHLLIAGTAETGGPAGIDAMMLSLLFRLPPSQCNLIIIGAESPELLAYDGLPHLLAPVIASPEKGAGALTWAVSEMNSRYERMSKAGVRNIASYNSNVAAAQLKGEPLRRTVQTGFHPVTGEPIDEEETFDPLPMPYLVIVAGELGSLMMHAGKEVEFAVHWLSQMARAAGIHLVMATQRPSAALVTDKIKTSFQSRICFQVSSKIESRAILGEPGAEQLLDAGDMLYLAAGARVIRAHGPCVQDREVEAVTRYWKAQGSPSYRSDILEARSAAGSGLPETMDPAGRFAAHDAA